MVQLVCANSAAGVSSRKVTHQTFTEIYGPSCWKMFVPLPKNQVALVAQGRGVAAWMV